MKKLHYDKSRVMEARDLRRRWYDGQKIERLPFTYAVRAKDGTRQGNPYTFGQMCRDTEKAVEGQIAAMQYQFDTFPDCDYLPCFDPSYMGEGILASMFGAKQLIVENNPPFVEGRFLQSIEEIDRLAEHPDIEDSEWGKKLKHFVTMCVEATDGEIPVAVCDYQSPYGTATKLLPNEELMMAMYDEPELVHALMDHMTRAIIEVLNAMEKWIGKDLLAVNRNNPIPDHGGIIMWDDYVSVITPELYQEFCAPYNRKLFDHYGPGHLHTCGPYFPRFIESCLACKPRSMDIRIMRGMARTREDLIEFRRITAEQGILLFGEPIIHQGSIFEGKGQEPDEALWRALLADGLALAQYTGKTAEEGRAFAEMVRRIGEETLNR